MTSHFRLAAAACALVLSSGAALADTQYVKIADGPDYEFSKAKCEIGAMGMEQQVNAHGSVGFVIAAELGNAIGNAIRMAQYTERCMIMHGWKKMRVEDVRRTAGQTPAAAAQPKPRFRTVARAEMQAAEPAAPRNASPARNGSIYASGGSEPVAPVAARRNVQASAADRQGRKLPFQYMQD